MEEHIEKQIDEQEMLEKLAMLEEMEWIGQKIVETAKRIYDIPQKEPLAIKLIYEALVSLPWIIKREEEVIKKMLSYRLLHSLILAEIPGYRRDSKNNEYNVRVENLELSPELPQTLREKIIPEIEIDAKHYGIRLEIPCREELPRKIIDLEIFDEIDFRTKPLHYIILISLRDVLWLALTLSDRDIERVVREIMRHSREDALLFTIYGVIVKKARQLLLSNPNLIEEAVKRRAEIEMKREKELEELLRKQNIPIARIPSERAITMRKALKDLRQGKDPEKTLKREIERFNFEIARVIHTKEVIDLFYGDEYRERVLFWYRMITVKDVLNIITNITKEDLEKDVTVMKNVARKAEVIAEYIEKLRSYASEVVSIYKYRIEELEKQTEKKLRAITA